MNIKDLGNRAVLTRSAGSRIGRDTALLCARLVICDLNEAGLKGPAPSVVTCSRRPSTTLRPCVRPAPAPAGERGNGHA